MKKLRSQFNQFPKPFRILVGATFIDRLGGALIFPFLSLYVAQKFNIGMTQVGLLFGTWSISSMIGSTIGGALADRFGRKIILVAGLIFSAGTALMLGFVDDLGVFYLIVAFTGIFSDIGHPAQQAMVADLLKGEQRAEGFSLLRIVANLAIIFGPAIGGILSGVSYLLLFIIDAFASALTAIIVFSAIPETNPTHEGPENRKTTLQTLAGYFHVAKDRLFVAFIIASIIMILVYAQMYSTLSVYLYREHGITARGFGFLMSTNAAMVVFMQFWITKKLKQYPPMLLMILASLLYGIGFTMFGFTGTYPLFIAAMAIITIGEMVHIPSAQALAAYFAPEDMRGRYMAAFGFTWAIPNSIAPFLAGLVMDNLNSDWVWYIAGILSIAAAAAFAFLYIKTRQCFSSA